MRLLIDMDGVTADLVPYWLSLINRYYGTHLKPEEVTDWYIHKMTPQLTQAQVEEFLKDPGFFLHLDPIPGAIPTLQTLIQEGHDVVFVTHCKYGHEDKRKWIERHLPEFPLSSVIFAERKDLIQGDVLLDDGLHNLEAWQNTYPDGTAICFDTPYNKAWQGYRVFDWSGFHLLVKALEK